MQRFCELLLMESPPIRGQTNGRFKPGPGFERRLQNTHWLKSIITRNGDHSSSRRSGSRGARTRGLKILSTQWTNGRLLLNVEGLAGETYDIDIVSLARW